MIPYDDLCRALKRYRAREYGEEYTEDGAAAAYGGDFDVDIEAEGSVAVADDEIIESADAGAYVEEGQYDVGDITDETAMTPEHQEYPPPDDQQAGEVQGEGGSGTIYGMGAPPPPPGEPEPQEGEAPPPPPDDEHRET